MNVRHHCFNDLAYDRLSFATRMVTGLQHRIHAWIEILPSHIQEMICGNEYAEGRPRSTEQKRCRQTLELRPGLCPGRPPTRVHSPVTETKLNHTHYRTYNNNLTNYLRRKTGSGLRCKS